MASKATVVRNDQHGILIEVQHLYSDSFSRSVDPTATRAWRKCANAGRFIYRCGDFGLDLITAADMVDPKAVTTSRVAFSTSFDAADRLLAEARVLAGQPPRPTA